MTSGLLTREQFRFAVFMRDKNLCVHCGDPGVDPHHILDRRLWRDGGYYIDNGVTLCAACHYAAEQCYIDPETLRSEAGIKNIVLPPDKWGECSREMRQKYPRTSHLPWSPGASDDDIILADTKVWAGKYVVITEKMDGECTTMYSDYMHVRSVDSGPHWSRERVKALHGGIKYNIPGSWRVCGENMTAEHSIGYDNLDALFLLFNIWNDNNVCLSWDETCEWAKLLDLTTVPLIYIGPYTEEIARNFCSSLDPKKQEGLVIRPFDAFHFDDFPSVVGKFVRKGHVQTSEHWMTAPPKYNRTKLRLSLHLVGGTKWHNLRTSSLRAKSHSTAASRGRSASSPKQSRAH